MPNFQRTDLVLLAIAALLTRASAFSSVTSTKICHGKSAIPTWSTAPGEGDVVNNLSNDDHVDDDEIHAPNQVSHIAFIKSTNIAGLVGDGERSEIRVDFGPDANLVAVTGESGSGKSLLISKAVDLVTGGKAIASLISSADADGKSSEHEIPSSVEIAVNIYEPHISSISTNLRRFGIDPLILYNGNGRSKSAQLHLKRTISLRSSGRLKSVCRINGKHISLKTLKQISAPLFTRVDAEVASAALGRPASRLAMLDIGVENSIKAKCAMSREKYRATKKRLISVQRDLESRALPASFQGRSGAVFDEEQVKLLEHWVDELDAFETRISRFQESLLAHYNELALDEPNAKRGLGYDILIGLQKSTWSAMHNSDSDNDSLLSCLLHFREEIQLKQNNVAVAHSAYESLTSLSSPNSASVALENVRKLLYALSSESGPLFDTIEKTHELLNEVEESLNKCARSIDGNSDSVLSTLEKMSLPGVSIEEVDCIIADWNALARKHGISPHLLPNCHISLQEELGGNVAALKLLPQAEDDERIAREDFSHACRELSNARKNVASILSETVTNLLPSLGLEGSAFEVQLNLRPGGFDKPYHGSESVGVDICDFLLLHKKNVKGLWSPMSLGGNIEQVGSSGEKSRVMLAIETALPGSIGSSCNSLRTSTDGVYGERDNLRMRPISIIYDEIDAHVGGRSAVTMAKLLADQARGRDSTVESKSGSQIVAITHSASLAATADFHIVVERRLDSQSTSPLVQTYKAEGPSRRKEIARMASGDLAPEEAEAFAEALIRDVQQKDKSHL